MLSLFTTLNKRVVIFYLEIKFLIHYLTSLYLVGLSISLIISLLASSRLSINIRRVARSRLSILSSYLALVKRILK